MKAFGTAELPAFILVRGTSHLHLPPLISRNVLALQRQYKKSLMRCFTHYSQGGVKYIFCAKIKHWTAGSPQMLWKRCCLCRDPRAALVWGSISRFNRPNLTLTQKQEKKTFGRENHKLRGLCECCTLRVWPQKPFHLFVGASVAVEQQSKAASISLKRYNSKANLPSTPPRFWGVYLLSPL